jgi:hypothetical protein
MTEDVRRKPISLVGYLPKKATYCPKCGASDIFYCDWSGSLNCNICDSSYYLVESDGSVLSYV